MYRAPLCPGHPLSIGLGDVSEGLWVMPLARSQVYVVYKPGVHEHSVPRHVLLPLNHPQDALPQRALCCS